MKKFDVREGGGGNWMGIVGDGKIAHCARDGSVAVVGRVVGRRQRNRSAVENSARTKTRYAEGKVLTQGWDISGVKGFALTWEFGSDGMANVASPFVLCRWWRIECWEMRSGGKGPWRSRGAPEERSAWVVSQRWRARCFIATMPGGHRK